MMSQLAALHLWHLHPSECQSKHFLLSKNLCIPLGEWDLMLPVTLQVQDHLVPQELPSASFGASCYKTTWVKLCCCILFLLGGKWGVWVQREAIEMLKRASQQESWSITLLLSNRGYIKRPRGNTQFMSCSSTPKRLYPPIPQIPTSTILGPWLAPAFVKTSFHSQKLRISFGF